jgi:hypothetical protein
MTRAYLASLARIADLDRNPYDVRALNKTEWASGDYVLAEITGPRTELYNIESCSGEMLPVQAGDQVIGALGVRAGTLEGAGDFASVVHGNMQTLTTAGLLGTFTSFSTLLPDPISLRYRGHILRDGGKVRMSDFAITSAPREFAVPTILLVGTSMSAGKTVAGRIVCKVLSSAGYKVIGAKITGAGRYKDIASFKLHGAFEIYDFVDAGLPSTIVPEDEYRAAIRPLLHFIAGRKPDFLVAEAGASPLEPYNGAAAMDELGGNICCTILCASDPYAVVGVQQAFGLTPDLVSGPAASTSAAIDLVKKLTGVPAINALDPGAERAFREFLGDTLKIGLSARQTA